MHKLLVLVWMVMSVALPAAAQEVTARVKVMDNQLPTTIDKKIFRTLETSLTNFINKRKWTNDSYKLNEKIECQFLLNLKSVIEQNVYEGTLMIQSARPVYQSTYQSPIVNYQDVNVVFKYVEGQPLEFNENRVSGSDPLVSNLTAVMVYYVYVILGYDYDSFSLRGGDEFFQKALNIVNNAPDASKITGWRSFEDINRNRYWLTENLINNRYALIHDFYYNYYRKGLDRMYEDEATAREEIFNALLQLENINKETPNLMIIQFFMLGKSGELIGIFKKASPQLRQRVAEILGKLDVSNANKYKQELK
ncbi:MAG: DUF4835 family protein [Bacteroidetes bacterium]|nr:DUF4835 family protein [Bacteroidota bacterium]